MSDTYGVVTGTSNDPSLPPVNLPSLGNARQPLRITVGPVQKTDPYADFPTELPKSAVAQSDPYADFPDKPPEKAPQRDVSTSEAGVRGLASGATFGGMPAIAGLAEASGMPSTNVSGEPTKPNEFDINPVRPIVGAAKMLHSWLSEHPNPTVKEAYERGRKAALADQKLADEQHPHAYLAGQLFGGLAVPIPGMAAASLGGRVLRGGVAGGIGGGAYGAGSAISEGKDASDVAKDALTGAAIGAPLGGALGGALGPRVANPNTPGQRAAQTATDLGAPLPRGVASDSRVVQATTAKLRSVPFAGERIGERVHDTANAAGGRIGDISDTMSGGVQGRAGADALVRPGIEAVIQSNRNAIDQAYNGVRSSIDQNAHFTMPRTQAALNGIRANRAAAGHPNPGQGLEQFDNVSRGATFNGAHRARVDAREAGNALVPHPGYNAADFNRLTQAMTTDIRGIVHASAIGNPNRAVQAFDEAERQFGHLAEQNGILHRLNNSRGEGAIATLLGATKENGGNVRLLAQLHATMPPQEFHQIGGALLYELGHNNSMGEFSLSQFATNWDKVSGRARAVLFSPQHLRDIEDIANLGTHIKGALRESNSSHTASVLVLLDLAKDAALLGHDMASGGLGAGAVVGAGSTAAVWLFTRWLASPATAASMGAWTRAYRGVTLNAPTPARQALFTMTTRNLAHNLGVPANDIIKAVQQRLPLAASQENNQSNHQ